MFTAKNLRCVLWAAAFHLSKLFVATFSVAGVIQWRLGLLLIHWLSCKRFRPTTFLHTPSVEPSFTCVVALLVFYRKTMLCVAQAVVLDYLEAHPRDLKIQNLQMEIQRVLGEEKLPDETVLFNFCKNLRRAHGEKAPFFWVALGITCIFEEPIPEEEYLWAMVSLWRFSIY